MAFAVTGVKAYGVEGEEPLSSKCYQQFLSLDITAANTDIDMDIGDMVAGSLGTFWTAAGGSTKGAIALRTLRQIVGRAANLHNVGGLSAYAQQITADLAAGGYTIAIANKAPNILFVTGNAPTAITVTLCWNLQVGVAPLHYVE